jgi:hypothetical protein
MEEAFIVTSKSELNLYRYSRKMVTCNGPPTTTNVSQFGLLQMYVSTRSAAFMYVLSLVHRCKQRVLSLRHIPPSDCMVYLFHVKKNY